MVKRTQLGEVMETSCTRCGCRFRLTEDQLRKAYGKVRCGECGSLFNALHGLKNFEGELPAGYLERLRAANAGAAAAASADVAAGERRELSLHEAMYGSERRAWFSFWNSSNSCLGQGVGSGVPSWTRSGPSAPTTAP